MTDRQRVVAVTGGGGGIGAAIAQALGRAGDFVVTLDPLVSLDGSQTLPAPEQTTADRIIAAGGAARASGVSVTDAPALQKLFTELADEFGGLDAVVNVAGISRPTSYTTGSSRDWQDVLAVHLDGYRNVLCAAMPLMAAAGRGHILGVTSGSGWRSADTGAYGCAKRAVAALTWQLGRHAPDGVTVNAISPIAATRMVAAALAKTSTSVTGGLSLAAMPSPEDLGALAAHLVADDFATCQGRVLFAAGSEIAMIDEPRLIEAVRDTDLPHLLDAAASIALVPAETHQITGGGGNARFGSILAEPAPAELPRPATHTCAVAADSPAVASAVAGALGRRGVSVTTVDEPAGLAGIPALDAVVIASSSTPSTAAAPGWQRILDEHGDIVAQIHRDARWSRAVADLAIATNRPIRLVGLHDAASAGGRSRAQAAAQLARAGRQATDGLVLPFTISAESDAIPADLIAHLLCSQLTGDLAGAELVTGEGWFGLRNHPRPVGSISFGGPDVPPWFDTALQEVVQPR